MEESVDDEGMEEPYTVADFEGTLISMRAQYLDEPRLQALRQVAMEKQIKRHQVDLMYAMHAEMDRDSDRADAISRKLRRLESERQTHFSPGNLRGEEKNAFVAASAISLMQYALRVCMNELEVTDDDEMTVPLVLRCEYFLRTREGGDAAMKIWEAMAKRFEHVAPVYAVIYAARHKFFDYIDLEENVEDQVGMPADSAES